MSIETEQVIMTADILVVWRGMLLLIQRRKPPYQGCWALPGGKLGEGETLEDAAHRELHEETGVEGVTMQFIGIYDDPERDPRGRYVSAAYVAAIGDNVVPRVEAGDEAGDARWFALNALPADLAFDHAEIIGMAMRPF